MASIAQALHKAKKECIGPEYQGDDKNDNCLLSIGKDRMLSGFWIRTFNLMDYKYTSHIVFRYVPEPSWCFPIGSMLQSQKATETVI